MTHIILTPETARSILTDTIRVELRGVWERGLDTAPQGVHALADKGAPAAFETIMAAADDLAAAVAALWSAKGCPPAVAADTGYDSGDHAAGPAITYQLTCGCSDWCNCAQCLAGTPHDEGTAWVCDTHGRTTVTWGFPPGGSVTEAAEGSLAICHSAQPFTLVAGHRMRAAKCLVCHLLIGSGQAVLVGVAALAGSACRCGGVVSDLFLVHASHMPMDADDLANAVHRGLACTVCHPAD